MRRSFIESREKSTISNSLKIWGTVSLISLLLLLTLFFILDSERTILEQENIKLNAKVEAIKHSDALKLANIKALNSFTDLELDYKKNMSIIAKQIRNDLDTIPKSVLLELYVINQNNTKFIGKVFRGGKRRIDYELMRGKFLERYSKSMLRLKSLPNNFDILTITNYKDDIL